MEQGERVVVIAAMPAVELAESAVAAMSNCSKTLAYVMKAGSLHTRTESGLRKMAREDGTDKSLEKVADGMQGV